MTGEEKRETRIIRCPACRRYYRIAAGPPAPGTRMRCSKCGEVFSLAAADPGAAVVAPAASSGAHTPAVPAVPKTNAPAKAPAVPRAPAAPGAVPGAPVPEQARVLVATDGEDFQSLIGEVLAAAGFSLRAVRSGDEAWAALETWQPHVALLDVALPGVPAFELCDRVRAHARLQGAGLILIASVFQQTRYKRAPTSLYGADDYIEKHHIRDWLPGKVVRLLPAGVSQSGPAGSPASGEAVAAHALPAAVAAAVPAAAAHHGSIDEREQGVLMREELYGPQVQQRKGEDRLHERLRRYARIIISDVALYNQELVERGIREGTFTELLKKEIEEGYRLYLARVPAASGGEHYYHEAVRDFIARRAGARGGASRPRGKP